MITFEDVKANPDIRTFIKKADEALGVLGYTEHSFAHVEFCAARAKNLLLSFGYSEREAELAAIAGYMHDIGNSVNRHDHAQSGAIMSFRFLDKMGMNAEEIATIIGAIGNHDEETAFPINPVAAALILVDKSDVRRTRVRAKDRAQFDDDIHDRVNYAVKKSELILSKDKKQLTLSLEIDTEICAVMDYFEIFMVRMILCKRAANFLGTEFKLKINDVPLI